MKKFSLLALVAGIFTLGLACGGGGGGPEGGSTSGIRFAGKTGDGLKVYGLDGTYANPEPLLFSGNFIPSGVDDKGTLDVELEAGNYRIRYVDNGLELMEFIVLESDFPSDGEEGTVNMGEMNGITTYLSSLFFKEVSLGKPRAKASEVLSALEAFFQARGMTSFQNATRGSIQTYLRTAEERTWANLTMINLRRVANKLANNETVSQNDWDSLVDVITDMAVLDSNGGDPSSRASDYLSLSSSLPELTEEDAEGLIIGLVSTDNQFATLLNMAQAASTAAFSAFQTQYESNQTADGIYAFLDLSTGVVTYTDELTLSEEQKDSVMVFSKVPASSSYPYFTGETDNAISLSEYYIGVYEVTEAQYGRLVEGDYAGAGPIHSISHANALSYASALESTIVTGGQIDLPTDAQWEVAARGSAATINDSSVEGYTTWNCFDNGGLTSGPLTVGSLQNANIYNLYDMYGNVAEFTRDRLTTVTDTTDPVGDTDLISVRGGSWFVRKEHCTVGHKEVSSDTSTANETTGFRLIFTKN